MTFTATELTGHQYLIEGHDTRGRYGQLVVDGTEWDYLKERAAMQRAHEAFDGKVEAFFAELIEAADELENAHRVELDPLLYVVEQEGSEGVAPRQEQIRVLTHDTVLLRAIEQGDTDRLVWVNDALVLTKVAQTSPAPTPAQPAPTSPTSNPADYSVQYGAPASDA